MSHLKPLSTKRTRKDKTRDQDNYSDSDNSKNSKNNRITKHKKNYYNDDDYDDFDNYDDYDNYKNDWLKIITLPPKKNRDLLKDKDKDKEKELIIKPICPNFLCNHKTFEEDPIEVEFEKITTINNIDDLINLGKAYHCQKNTHYSNIDLKLLCNLVNPLTELQNMVGLKNVKESMVNQILFFLQGFNQKISIDGFGQKTTNTDMMHTVITGPPGVGKTELGKILGKVYKAMGVLSKGTFKLVARSDLIAKYLGQTAVKTQEVIDSCIGGVLFIDEAYALGHEEGRDSFSKECLDTLNQNLSEKRDLLCIIAGYNDALEKCFFNMNDGLRRRFTFRYDITGYNASELQQIFEAKLKQDMWGLDFDSENEKKYGEFFKKNYKKFVNYGGDVETLFLKCKIAHSKRVIFEPENKRRLLSIYDIKKGFSEFLIGRHGEKNQDKNQEKNKIILGLYD